MKILGVDASINGSGFCILEIDDSFKQISASFVGFSKIKKLERHSDDVHIIHLDKYYADYPYHHRGTIICNLFNKYHNIADIDFMAIEDYAFGASGKVFDIAETIGAIKNQFYTSSIPYKKYPPSVIKQFATGKGNSDKVFMGMAYNRNVEGSLTDLEDYTSPKADLVDAFWIAQLLRFELCYKATGQFPSDLFLSLQDHSIEAIVGGKKKKSKTLPAIMHPVIQLRSVV